MAKVKSLTSSRKHTRERADPGLGRFALGLCAAVFYPLTTALARVEVTGLERIPAEGPALLVFNHVSHLDPLYDSVTVHRAARIPRFLAKDSLWKVPVLRNVLNGVGQIPVSRGTADARRSLRAAHHALEAGRAVLIYPDGTVTKDPHGWPMTPKVGMARLALEHDVPVIPAARWGTREIYDHYAKRFRPLPRKRVTIALGEPIDLSAYRGREQDARLLREVTDVTMRRVRELLGEVRDQRPPEEFYSSPAKSDRSDHA